MSIAEQKLELIQKISQLDEESLQKVMDLVNKVLGNTSDWWDQLPESSKQRIAKAEEELKQGKGIPWEEVKASIKAKYGV